MQKSLVKGIQKVNKNAHINVLNLKNIAPPNLCKSKKGTLEEIDMFKSGF